jgi:hypothetical protein
VKSRLVAQVALALLVAVVAVPPARATQDDGYKSGYPQLHALLTRRVPAPPATAPDRSFHWRDAAIGAATAAGSIFVLACAAVVLVQRRSTRVSL